MTPDPSCPYTVADFEAQADLARWLHSRAVPHLRAAARLRAQVDQQAALIVEYQREQDERCHAIVAEQQEIATLRQQVDQAARPTPTDLEQALSEARCSDRSTGSVPKSLR